MREAVGNLWDYQKGGAVLAITVNGELTDDGKAVMGKGIARAARDRLWNIDQVLGDLIKEYGNRCFRIQRDVVNPKWTWSLVTVPTKDKWRKPSDLKLIEQSAHQLVAMADKFGWTEVVTVRWGTGNGQLDWSAVKPVIEPILDDRFLFLHGEGE